MKEPTTKQKEFVDKFLETGNKRQSALATYDTTSPTTASHIADNNLQSANVREYIETKARPAAETIFNLSQNAENEGVRLGASKDILDRAGYKPIERTQSVSVEIKGNVEDFAKLDEVRQKYEAELRAKLTQ